MLRIVKPGLSLVAISWNPITCSHHRALRSPSVTVRSMCPNPFTAGKSIATFWRAKRRHALGGSRSTPELPHWRVPTGQYGVVDEALATRLRTAFNARDIDAFRSLLAVGATWGEDPNGESFCHDRDSIIGNLKKLLAEGVRATVVETTTGPRGIAAQVEVEWPDAQEARPDRISFFQVYVVSDGLVTEIHGHDDRDSA